MSSELRLPPSSCKISIVAGGVELKCVKCGATMTHGLPDTLELFLQRGRDFSNYHRWCSSGSAVARAPKEPEGK